MTVRPYKKPYWKILMWILVGCVIVFLAAVPVQAAAIQENPYPHYQRVCSGV